MNAKNKSAFDMIRIGSEIIREVNRIMDLKDIETLTDKELADELRKRGYEVTAIKKTIIEL